MMLVARVKLLPTADQASTLLATLCQCNHACNWMAGEAWEHQVFGQFSLHKLVYRPTRERFGLAAQMAVRAIAKVADAYKLDRSHRCTFRALGAVPYDGRILSWRLADGTISILTLAGRQTMPFVCRARDRDLLAGKRGEADLCRIDGSWYLLVACEVETPPTLAVEAYLGVDMGIVNIATDSDGRTYSGAQVNGLRRRHRKLRQRLQTKRSKSARRLLTKRRRKERRFARDVNHCIAKRIVAEAERTGRGIALEELTGIRDRVRARRSQRATLHAWAFRQLGQYIAYKAALVGVLVTFVDPRNTSRECPACGRIDKANRPVQASFSCIGCGYSGPADTIAAGNIARRAAVNRPHAGGFQPHLQATGWKPVVC